jgi:hypothetical protein
MLVYLVVSPTTAGCGLVFVFSIHRCWPQATPSTYSSSRPLTRSSPVVISSRLTSSKLLVGPFHPVFFHRHRRSSSCSSSSSFIKLYSTHRLSSSASVSRHIPFAQHGRLRNARGRCSRTSTANHLRRIAIRLRYRGGRRANPKYK